MLHASSVALRAGFFGASAAVHVAAFVTFGHAPPSPARAVTPSESIAVDELAPSFEEPGPDPAPPAERRARLAAPPTHRHSYPVAADHDARPHDPSLVTTDEAPAKFMMVVSSVVSSLVSSTVAGASGSAPLPRAAPPGPGGTDAPLDESTVSSPAHPAEAIRPIYPAVARAQGVEGDVTLVVEVAANGTVQGASVEKRAGFGFDEAALTAVRAARFEPARREGRAVAVRMRLGYSFRLQ